MYLTVKVYCSTITAIYMYCIMYHNCLYQATRLGNKNRDEERWGKAQRKLSFRYITTQIKVLFESDKFYSQDLDLNSHYLP